MSKKKPVKLPDHLEERYKKAKQEGLERHYAESSPQLLKVDHYDVITGMEHGKYKGEINFFFPDGSTTVLFEFDPSEDVWRTTHDWND